MITAVAIAVLGIILVVLSVRGQKSCAAVGPSPGAAIRARMPFGGGESGGRPNARAIRAAMGTTDSQYRPGGNPVGNPGAYRTQHNATGLNGQWAGGGVGGNGQPIRASMPKPEAGIKPAYIPTQMQMQQAGAFGSGFQSKPGTRLVTPSESFARRTMAGHAQYRPRDPRYAIVASAQNPSDCPAGVDPAPYNPYNSAAASAYTTVYPNEESQASLAPRGCGVPQSQGYELNINALMPSAWKASSASCGDMGVDNTLWSKYAPTRAAFDNYVSSAGSMRLGLNTRSPLGRICGIPLLLRQGAAVPLSAQEYEFNDSGFRQDLVFSQVGTYPRATNC